MSSTRHALRRGTPPREPDHGADPQAELTLLREENSRLKARLDQPPDLTRLMGHVQRPRLASSWDEPVDEAASLLAEDLVIREGLLEVCRELLRFLTDLEARLAEGATRA
jgi:hypothetical protein